MKTLLTFALVWGFATPAAAAGCVTVAVSHVDWHHIESVDNQTGWKVTHALVGHYVWFQFGHDKETTSSDGVDTLSFDISDGTVESLTACPDGSVEIRHTPEIVNDVDEPSEVPVVAPDVPEQPAEPVAFINSGGDASNYRYVDWSTLDALGRLLDRYGVYVD